MAQASMTMKHMLRNCEIMDTFLYLTSGVYGVRNILKYCRKV